MWEIDLYTTLEIVNEMWERGFKFGRKLDLYRSDRRIHHRWRHPNPAICRAMDGLGRTQPKTVCELAKKEVLSKTELRKRGGVSSAYGRKMD